MNVRKHLTGIALLAGSVLIAACSSEAPPAKPAEPASAPPAAVAAPPAAAKRVFFVEPAEGASVKSPVKLKFGIEGVEISPVPAGEVVTARAGMGHFHVGVDTECLAPGTVIPKAAPWVHFGNGSSEIDMQLPAGQHKIALQAGDDLHATIAGLCSMLTVNVTP